MSRFIVTLDGLSLCCSPDLMDYQAFSRKASQGFNEIDVEE